MSEWFLIRTVSGSVVPADSETAEKVAKLRPGQGVRGEFKKARDITKHRRMFALFNFAFDWWDGPDIEHKGQRMEKNFDRFRRDATILAGFYTETAGLDSSVQLEAKSLAFHNMKQDEFDAVYRGVLNVVWTRILKSKGYETPEQVDAIVHELLRFE